MNLLHQRIGGHEGISKLLRHFYADVRQDPLIGPIFKDQGLETSLGNHGDGTGSITRPEIFTLPHRFGKGGTTSRFNW